MSESTSSLRLRFGLHAASFAFFAFGVWGVVAPQVMLAFVGVHEIPVEGLIEFRAYYGGLELGFAAFLQFCARRSAFALPGLLGASSIFFGCALVRGLGIIVASRYSWPLLASFFGELAFAIMSFIICRDELARESDAT